jgi:N-acetylglucosaminylphosphatidylinositol deacetylase
LAYVVGNRAGLAPLGLHDTKNLLVVTAHPDDECLFFSPSILGILDAFPNLRGGLLSLSTGKISSQLTFLKMRLERSCGSLQGIIMESGIHGKLNLRAPAKPLASMPKDA